MEKLTLQNFRTYQETTSIDLAPVNILTGKNNVGKSTVFKALILLSDFLGSSNQLVLEFDGPSAHKHKIDCFANALTWRNKQPKYTRRDEFVITYIRKGYEFSFIFKKDKSKSGLLDQLNIIHLESGYRLIWERLSEYHFQIKMDNEFINTHYDFRQTDQDNDLKEISKQIRLLSREKRELNKQVHNLSDPSIGSNTQMDLLVHRENINKRLESLRVRKKNLESELYHKPVKNELSMKIDIDISDEIEAPDYKIMSLIRRALLSTYYSKDFKKSFGVSDRSKDRFRVIRFFDHLEYAMNFNICHLGPNRTHQARLYITRNRENEINEIINYYAHNKPAKSTKIDRFLKNWMRTFDIGDELEVNDFQATASYIEITDNGHTQNLTDKGFGAGQVLTMLLKIVNEVQKSKPSRQTNRMQRVTLPTIIIEEPETNLHPEFQSKLAEMFYDASKQFGIRFILETHSEYLIRKTQSIIKQSNDLSVFKIYYVDKERGLYEMRYRPDGKFIDEFGPGFFDESTNLTLDLF